MVEKTSRKVFCYDTNFNFLSAFTSTSNTARELKLSQGNITLACLGALKHYKGMIFSYEENLTKEKHEEILEKGKEKYEKRLKQVIDACVRWQEKNRKRVAAYQRNLYYRKKYNMTEREYKQQQLDKLDDN